MKVAVIDYGSGNLRSAVKSFERAARENDINAQILLVDKPEDVRKADRVVLPGVGAYADCRKGLDRAGGMVEALNEVVIKKARPFLGICVGMQLMSDRGLEKTTTKGLGWIPGDVVEFKVNDKNLKIPQMGWNTIDLKKDHALFENIPTGPSGKHAYFVHSYHFVPKDENDIVATVNYGGQVTAVVAKDNMIGTQFHPEKSQELGLALISNFLKWSV